MSVSVTDDRKEQSWTQSAAGPDDIKVSLEFSWLALIKPGGEKEEELGRWRQCGVSTLCLAASLSLSHPLCSLSVSLLLCWLSGLAEWGTCCVLYGPSVTYSALPSA